jgi:hypothetical protein
MAADHPGPGDHRCAVTAMVAETTAADRTALSRYFSNRPSRLHLVLLTVNLEYASMGGLRGILAEGNPEPPDIFAASSLVLTFGPGPRSIGTRP